MFTILGRGQVRLHRRAWERSFLCAYLIFADVLLHLKIQFDKFDFFLKKILKNFWNYFWKYFFLKKFFFEKKFSKFFSKNFIENYFFKIFFFFFLFFFEVDVFILKCLTWFRFWMSFQILWFHLFHNAHTISALSFNISFHFEFQVSSKEI